MLSALSLQRAPYACVGLGSEVQQPHSTTPWGTWGCICPRTWSVAHRYAHTNSADILPSTGRLKEHCGLPFSCVLQPYHRLSEKEAAAGDASSVRSEAIARCSHCYA